MSKKQVHTTMLGRTVQVMSKEEMQRNWPGGHGRFQNERAGQTGEVVNVYQTSDGICYDVLFADGTIWVDCWQGFFKVRVD